MFRAKLNTIHLKIGGYTESDSQLPGLKSVSSGRKALTIKISASNRKGLESNDVLNGYGFERERMGSFNNMRSTKIPPRIIIVGLIASLPTYDTGDHPVMSPIKPSI